MPQTQQYCLKASKELFDEIDRQRMMLAGISNIHGTSRADYIRDAIQHYNEYHSEIVESKVAKFKVIEEEHDEPLMFYHSNGVDISW